MFTLLQNQFFFSKLHGGTNSCVLTFACLQSRQNWWLTRASSSQSDTWIEPPGEGRSFWVRGRPRTGRKGRWRRRRMTPLWENCGQSAWNTWIIHQMLKLKPLMSFEPITDLQIGFFSAKTKMNFAYLINDVPVRLVTLDYKSQPNYAKNNNLHSKKKTVN